MSCIKVIANEVVPRAWNNFPAGAGQVVRSNLFLLGHNPLLARQTSITSYLYNPSPPQPPTPTPHDVYISNKYIKYIFYAFIVQAASNSTQEKWNARYSRNVRQNQYIHLCIHLSLQFYVFYTVKFQVMKLIKLKLAIYLILIIMQANWCEYTTRNTYK